MTTTRRTDALDAFLTDGGHLPPAEDVSVRPLGDGNANETLLLVRDGREYVVRAPPPTDAAPALLHDLLREFEVLDALADAAVPTPPVVAACEDESVLGAPFYVMERVAGDVMTDSELDRIETREHRRAVGSEVVDALAALHTVDHRAVGLGDFGEGDGYLERELDRLTAQLDWARERTAGARVDADRVHGRLDAAREWLGENVPERSTTAVVHGDYKLDNLLWSPGTPVELGAVLDWEMATLGDPRADLGWLVAFWNEARDPEPLTADVRATYRDHDLYPMLETFARDYGQFTGREGYHDRRELVARYEDLTGVAFDHDRFFRALAVYKLAAILESFYRVSLEDPEHAKATYPVMELLVPSLAVSVNRIVDGETPL